MGQAHSVAYHLAALGAVLSDHVPVVFLHHLAADVSEGTLPGPHGWGACKSGRFPPLLRGNWSFVLRLRLHTRHQNDRQHQRDTTADGMHRLLWGCHYAVRVHPDAGNGYG